MRLDSRSTVYFPIHQLTDGSPGSVLFQVTGSLSNIQLRLKEHLARLDEIFSPRQDYTQTLRFMQQMADNIIRQLTAMPNISQARQDLETVADQASYIEYYR